MITVTRKERSRNWEVKNDGRLVVLAVYKKGAEEVKRILDTMIAAGIQIPESTNIKGDS